MIILPPTPTTIEEALTVLRRGGLVAHATETCYGFACDLTNPDAVAQLFRIKKRPVDQPVSALFRAIATAKQYVVWSAQAEELASQYLPGPLTLILPLRPDAPHALFPKLSAFGFQLSEKRDTQLVARSWRLETTLGVRISSHPLAQELVARFGIPISTTSANIHGEPNPYDARAIAERFAREASQPDLIIDSGMLLEVPPSTVVDLTQEEKILRRGPV